MTEHLCEGTDQLSRADALAERADGLRARTDQREVRA